MSNVIDLERLNEALEENLCGLGNIGFCRACGAEHDSCEPDAQNYECYECGKFEVFGAEILAISF
jgi:hypothetical protein